MDTWSSIISNADLEGQGLGTTQLLTNILGVHARFGILYVCMYITCTYIHIPNVCTNTLLVHMYESGDVSWNQ